MLFGLDGARAILLWWTLPAYMTLIGAALAASGVVLVWRTQGAWRISHAVDSGLLATALGLILGRAEHVAANWQYFSEAPREVFSISAGGLDAHGAILGAVIGGYVASHWFRASFDAWLGAVAFALPLVAFAAWWGCAAASCAYGAEVPNLADYPSWLVWEAQGDFLMVAPRYAVQPIGMVASAAVLLNVILAASGFQGRRLAGIALLGVSATSFALGFLRGDLSSAVASLSLGQIFDLIFIATGVVLALPRRRLDAPSA